MKTFNKLFSIAAMAFLLLLAAPHKSMAQDGGYVSDQEFYDELQQYGTWVQDDQYGDVWVPDVDEDFRPYATNGYWVQTDYGSTWVSDYPWGWATFHYGRWRYDDYYGWEWIPGHEWAPAWVSWRQGGGYYGWAPMGPGVNITLSFGGVGVNIPDNYWVYTPARYITSRYVYRYYTPHTRIVNVIRRTTIIHNTYVYNNRAYITGPRPRDIQRITRQKVVVYKINNASRPGAFQVGVKNTINIYRPAVRKAPDARPVRVVSATAYKNEHPTAGIGNRGATGYNRGNAAKLAATVRADKPNSNVVKVFPKKTGENKPEGAKGNEPNKANEPVRGNEPNKPNEPARGNEPNRPGEPSQNNNDPNRSNIPAGDKQKPAEKKGHHKFGEPAQTPPAQQPASQVPQHPVINKPEQAPVNTAPTQQPAQAGGFKGRQHKKAPAVMPAEQHNADQPQQQPRQQEQEAAQQQKSQQQEAQKAARDQARQQQRQQQQQVQQAAQQQRQQQQQAQQQQRQAAQQQKQQQQQAQRAAKQAAEQQRKQEQEQKKQDGPPSGNK